MPVLPTTSHAATEYAVRPPEFSRAERVRVLTLTAAGSVVIGYAAVAALLALVSSTAAHAAFSTTGVLAAAAPGWLAAHHVPLRFDGGQLGVLPLLPTALVMLLVHRAAASAADRLGLFEPLQARAVVLGIAGAHATVGGLIAFLMGDEGEGVRATPAVAFFGCAAVSGVAALSGVAQRCGLVDLLFERVDPVARRGLRAAALGLSALVAAGALMFAVGLLVSWSTTSLLFDGTVGTGLGLFLLCLAYLPNALVGAVSFVVGSGFSIGVVQVGPLSSTGGPVPAVPLLAALPEQHVAVLPLVLILPGAVGVLVGWSLRDAAGRPAARARAVLVAAVASAVVVLVLAAVAGGALGGGVFNPVTIPAGLLALLTFGWVLVPGGIVAWFAGPKAGAEVEPDSGTAAAVVEPDADSDSDEPADEDLPEPVAEEDEPEAEDDADSDSEDDLDDDPEDHPDGDLTGESDDPEDLDDESDPDFVDEEDLDDYFDRDADDEAVTTDPDAHPDTDTDTESEEDLPGKRD
ncbi:hypothetical protein GCM10022243_05790 [Saccharothrix violaceirubra]|uniref:Uncharacterized protein n=1 Tax=Saccharothrix violaceirubra TaxID=413306 RepID=A0A7W7WTD6_9PSEU|nr:DUF6350 family protein [Saccharothrix violaceirubra]MBB4962989.1 hypothetical protein [Saccharothrix violaceirubra]